MITWLIGMSGVGKTEIGKRLFKRLQMDHKNIVFLDGDLIRYIMGNDLGHTMEDRRKNADRICRLCKTLDDQNLNVVCCILSIFPESREWNRKNYSKYFEIFIDVDFEILKKRDNKNIYARALSGELTNVVGVDIKFPKPQNPDLILNNNKDEEDLEKVVDYIITKLPSLD